MRTMTGAIVMALGLAATPVFAGELGASAGTGAASAQIGAGLASLPIVAAAVLPAIAVAPAAPLAQNAAPTFVNIAAKPASDASFRLGTLTAAVTMRPVLGFATRTDGAIQRRFGSGMFDFFPAAGSGFHLSGGTRLFQRRNFLAETERSAGGIMAGPRATSGATTYGAGFKRFNPAITAGYTMAVSKLTQVGVEAGALMGAAYSGAPGLARYAVGYRGEHEFRPNGIVRAVYGMRF